MALWPRPESYLNADGSLYMLTCGGLICKNDLCPNGTARHLLVKLDAKAVEENTVSIPSHTICYKANKKRNHTKRNKKDKNTKEVENMIDVNKKFWPSMEQNQTLENKINRSQQYTLKNFMKPDKYVNECRVIVFLMDASQIYVGNDQPKVSAIKLDEFRLYAENY